MQQANTRDLYIDTIRGICTLSVVFIHTAFWSGGSYVPDWVRNLALLVDVPLFFFLAGATMSTHPKMNPLKQMFKLMVLFFFAVLICQIIFLDFNLKTLMAPLFFAGARVPQVKLIQGSYWFVPVYVSSLLLAKIMLDYLKPFVINVFLILAPVFYIYSYFTNSIYNEPCFLRGGGTASFQMVVFHLWLMVLGFRIYKFDKKVIWWIIAVFSFLATLIFCFYLGDNFVLQNYKFPTQLPYIVATMISVALVMALKTVLKTKLKENVFAYLGKNAICFYLSQGISSSILFSITRIIHTVWYIKLPICFIINVIMAIIIGVLILKIEPKLTSLITKK